LVQWKECPDCKYWNEKIGCKKFITPPDDYKKCAYFETGKISNENDEVPSLRG
jgi:hypothetical protein